MRGKILNIKFLKVNKEGRGGGGGYGFKLFTLELKIIDALQQIFVFINLSLFHIL